jgi:glycosyltransferase involved in cell wall biosynthesis
MGTRLLLVTGIFPPDRGGPASYVPRVAGELAARGMRVEVVCLSDPGPHDDAGYPFPVHRIPRQTFWPWRVLITLAAIFERARRSDLIYVSGLGAESALAAVLAGRPTVYKVVGDYAWERAVGRGWFQGTIEDYQSKCRAGRFRWINLIRTWPLSRAARVIVPSRYLARLVASWGIPESRIAVIYNAASNGRGKPRSAEPWPEWTGRTLITVCRLVPWKGVSGLIEVLGSLPTTRLVIAGDGGMRADLTEQARRLGVAERVLFLGDVPGECVASCMRRADAFVLNSTYEGLPHVVLEAMEAGVPVIATDAGGTGELVEHGVTGLLIPVGRPEMLKAAIESLWKDPSLAERLVAGASQRVAENFAASQMLDQTERVLRGVLEEPKRAPVAGLFETEP